MLKYYIVNTVKNDNINGIEILFWIPLKFSIFNVIEKFEWKSYKKKLFLNHIKKNFFLKK